MLIARIQTYRQTDKQVMRNRMDSGMGEGSLKSYRDSSHNDTSVPHVTKLGSLR
jgi:hypothetical protein